MKKRKDRCRFYEDGCRSFPTQEIDRADGGVMLLCKRHATMMIDYALEQGREVEVTEGGVTSKVVGRKPKN